MGCSRRPCSSDDTRHSSHLISEGTQAHRCPDVYPFFNVNPPAAPVRHTDAPFSSRARESRFLGSPFDSRGPRPIVENVSSSPRRLRRALVHTAHLYIRPRSSLFISTTSSEIVGDLRDCRRRSWVKFGARRPFSYVLSTISEIDRRSRRSSS